MVLMGLDELRRAELQRRPERLHRQLLSRPGAMPGCDTVPHGEKGRPQSSRMRFGFPACRLQCIPRGDSSSLCILACSKLTKGNAA
jgi:hypothetical protein